MSTPFGAGFHAQPGKAVDALAYDRWTGRWSRLFIPDVLAAAVVKPGCRVLDVSTGTGEAAGMALPLVGVEGLVVGADISPAMLTSARMRLSPTWLSWAESLVTFSSTSGIFTSTS